MTTVNNLAAQLARIALPQAQVFDGARLGTLGGIGVGYLLISYGNAWLHRSYHRSPWLWRFVHRLHHAPERIDVAGVMYQSPPESATHRHPQGDDFLGRCGFEVGIEQRQPAEPFIRLDVNSGGRQSHGGTAERGADRGPAKAAGNREDAGFLRDQFDDLVRDVSVSGSASVRGRPKADFVTPAKD